LALLAILPLALAACATSQEEATSQENATSQEEQTEAAAPAAESDRIPWDAEKMTALTGDLARSVRDVRRAWRKDPAFANPNNPNRRAAMELDQTLQMLDQRATQLHNRVKAGGGYEETLNIVRNIGTLLNDIDVNGRRIMPSEWMDERVRPTMVLINEIAPYYGSEALFDPETMQRTDRPPRRR
jgi:hypothetical protein